MSLKIIVLKSLHFPGNNELIFLPVIHLSIERTQSLYTSQTFTGHNASPVMGLTSISDTPQEPKLVRVQIQIQNLYSHNVILLPPSQQWSLQGYGWTRLPCLIFWYPLVILKSLQLIWRLGTRRFHRRVPDLQMSCSDLTKWWGTVFVVPVIATGVICPNRKSHQDFESFRTSQ